jgi:hypothetical protein
VDFHKLLYLRHAGHVQAPCCRDFSFGGKAILFEGLIESFQNHRQQTTYGLTLLSSLYLKLAAR